MKGSVCYLILVIATCLAACSYSDRSPAPVRTAGSGGSGYGKASYTGSVYQVQPGDTLYSIAWLTGHDFKELADRNNIKPPYLIYRGQRLKINSPKVRKSQPNQAPPKRKISSPPQQKKLEKRHEKIVDSNSSGGYGQAQADRNAQLAQAKPQRSQKKLQWRWPTQGKVVSQFSTSQTGAKGIDIRGKFGQPVKAAGDGKIVYAGSGLRGYGELIIIKHSEQFLSAYAHNSRLRVKEGDWVKAGQLIANMGSTGTNSVKLRFEIRVKGRPVDPLRYLPR